MTLHLWCSSNNIIDNSIRLCLFQCTLIGAAAKWYIELPQDKYPNFNSLAFMFLQYFQLPVRYNEGVEILLCYRQNTATHITDHIHEWRWRRSLCKIQLDDRIFLDWFLKTFLPPIAKDVAYEHPQCKEEAILKAQQFDLIYAQSRYLYTVILDAPCPSTSYRDAPGESHVADDIIGSVSQQPQPRLTPPTITLQPSNTASVAYQNQALDYARMMSQAEATTSYAQPMPP